MTNTNSAIGLFGITGKFLMIPGESDRLPWMDDITESTVIDNSEFQTTSFRFDCTGKGMSESKIESLQYRN
jgi:hypothetical protein